LGSTHVKAESKCVGEIEPRRKVPINKIKPLERAMDNVLVIQKRV